MTDSTNIECLSHIMLLTNKKLNTNLYLYMKTSSCNFCWKKCFRMPAVARPTSTWSPWSSSTSKSPDSPKTIIPGYFHRIRLMCSRIMLSLGWCDRTEKVPNNSVVLKLVNGRFGNCYHPDNTISFPGSQSDHIKRIPKCITV